MYKGVAREQALFFLSLLSPFVLCRVYVYILGAAAGSFFFFYLIRVYDAAPGYKGKNSHQGAKVSVR